MTEPRSTIVDALTDPGDRLRWARAIDAATAGRGVSVVFQPIVDLRTGEVAGYEALARFSHETLEHGPERWFSEAAAGGSLANLDAALLRRALAFRRSLPPDCFLAVNVEPSTLLTPIGREALASSGDLDGVVVELTEHRSVPTEALLPVLDGIRAAGALIALDDAGSGHAGLTQMLELRPSIVKLDMSLITGIDGDEAKAAMVEMVGVFATRVDARVLAEGIETEGELARLVDLGVPLGQGFHLGRPAASWTVPSAAVQDRLSVPRPSDEPLRSLVRTVPTVDIDADDLAAPFADHDGDHLVAVDHRGRPVGIVTPFSALQDHAVPALTVSVTTSVPDAGHRWSTWTGDTTVPVIVTDATGHLVGIVPLPRLVGALSHGAED